MAETWGAIEGELDGEQRHAPAEALAAIRAAAAGLGAEAPATPSQGRLR